jgi:predicted Zn-dependent protease
MNIITKLLQANTDVTDYKINIHRKETCELFYIHGKLETVRAADNCEKEVTVYVDHDGFKGDAQFHVYPSTTEEQLVSLIAEAVAKAKLINNKPYSLPLAETGEYVVESNFRDYGAADLASMISDAVFDANTITGASLNSVEIFINKHTETVLNSQGLHKTQTRYDAMVEAIPTFNGAAQSVELYEQYNFSHFASENITAEIAGKLQEVKLRYEAITPDFPLNCKVVLNKLELSELFESIADDLNYATDYSHSNLRSKGDFVQKDPTGDKFGITMHGSIPGCIRSAKFDGDGLSLSSIRLVEDSKVVNYYGANRYGQYLGEVPTGNLRCLSVDSGSADEAAFSSEPTLEIISMSGLQVDFYSDYIGGEIRLAYYHDGNKVTAVTGVSISGSLNEVLQDIRLSQNTGIYNGYCGPEKAILDHLKIF